MNDKRGVTVMAGDVGGTKTALGLFSVESGKEVRITPVREKRFENSAYAGLDEMLGEFIAGGHPEEVRGVTLGVASPVEDNRGVLTNLSWVIDGVAIGKRFGLGGVALINDLAATAWGIDLLSKEDIVTLKEGKVRPGSAAVISPGTGLGESILFWDGVAHTPIASEGGHADFAPRDAVEIELFNYLSGIYGHVSYERVLSGPGLKNLYDFFRTKSIGTEPEGLRKGSATEVAPPVIVDEGLKGTDEASTMALTLFVSILGAEAGNLALKSMATGGVYVAGGMAPRILDALKGRAFSESFVKKGRLERVLRDIPVYAVLNEMAPLYGAARHAAIGALGVETSQKRFAVSVAKSRARDRSPVKAP